MKSYKARLKLIDDAILINSGKWVSPFNHLIVSTKYHHGVGEGHYITIDITGQNRCAKPYWEYVCSKEEFMQRKQELQNKPSWEDAPKWANWLAQDSSGQWYWYGDKPTADNDCKEWDSEMIPHPSEKGEVIGDWRDTLEERPAIIRHTINAEHTDIIMPDGTKVRLLDLLLEHNAVKRYELEQEVAQVIDDNYGRDALSVARAVLKTLEEKNNER